MSVDRTYTVTVVSGNPSNHPYHNVGSTNKYAIDGSTATADVTLSLPEGGTFRFDQSDYYNSGHPLRFSTTPNGTHGGGTEYTTGVTTNGTPGSSGAYTQITVAADAPTLYYYCTNHSAMGWTANTVDEDVWGAGNWSAGRWGITDEFTTGWGAKAWDSSGSWGDMGDETVTPTGLGLTSSIGSVSVTAEINTGWGRAAWNDDAWGIQGDILLTGVSATTSVGSLTVGDIIGLTGVSSTTSVGSPTIVGDITQAITGVSATTSVGSIAPADVMGLTGVSATGSVGALTPADVIGVTGVSATTSIGEVNVTSNPTIQLTGVSVTSSVGSIAPADIMGLTGVSATASVGALTPADVMGLTGVSATASVAELGTSDKFGIQAYQAIDTGSNTSYTDVAA
jgi:hypothetical protein|tara:strand:- start:985 stop:2172 length:1188 start_codon:yes stop_codon:yes gene_type:complete